jgi:Family of unknown function (DUF6418)
MIKLSFSLKLFLLYVISLTLCIFSFMSFENYYIANTLSVICYFVFFIIVYRERQLLFFIFLPLAFPHLTAIVSNFYIDTGTYISELSIYSQSTGAVNRLVFLVLTMFIVAVTFSNFFIEKFKFSQYYLNFSIKGFEKNFIKVFAFIIISILILGLLKWGTPLSLSEQRFEFWANHPFPMLRGILYQTYLIGFLAGCSYIHSNNKKTVIFIMLMVIVTNLLYGEKFTGIYLPLMYYVIGYMISYYIINNNGRRVITIGVVFFSLILLIIVFSIVYYQYKYIHNVGNDVVGYIIARIFSLQGEVWWGVDHYYFDESLSPKLKYLFQEGSSCDNYGGLYYLMREIAPWSLVSSYCDRGVTFTMGFPAIGLATLGFFNTIIFCFVAGLLLALTAVLVTDSIRNKNYIAMFVSFKVILIETHALAMGNVFNIIDFKFAVYLIALFFISRIRFSYV